MNNLYYEKLEETDKRLEAITNWRNRKFVKLNKKIDKVIDKASKKTKKAMAEVGATIPLEVKRGRK
jgi:hypothetical protein